MYTALEKHRSYLIGEGDKATSYVFLGRTWPEDDHPPVFEFLDPASGQVIAFLIEQLTMLESMGALRYQGLQPEPLPPSQPEE